MILDMQTIEVGDRLIAFSDADGNPIEHLHIRFHKDEASDFVSLLVSMRRAAGAHGDNYRVGVDRNTILALEALSTTVELALGVDPQDLPIDIVGDIVAFHEKFDLGYYGQPRSLNEVFDDVGQNQFDFRLGFDREETNEYEEEQAHLNDAINLQDDEGIVERLHKQLDALVDGVYVKVGTAYLQFGPRIFKEAWRRVHRANMLKKRAERVEESKRGSLFDVVKPEGWIEPDHRDLVRDHAHKPGLNEASIEDINTAQ